MLVESIGYNLISISMMCDLNMLVLFGKYGCVVFMENDRSIVFKGVRKEICTLLTSLKVLKSLHAFLLEKLNAGSGIEDLDMLA